MLARGGKAEVNRRGKGALEVRPALSGKDGRDREFDDV